MPRPTRWRRKRRKHSAPGSASSRWSQEADSQFQKREAERIHLEEVLAELKKLNPAEGEWERVSAEQKRLAHGSSLLGGAQSALETLAEAEGACLPQLAAIASRLRALSAHDARLAAIVELLDSAEAQAGEAARELRQYASRVDLDPDALREVEARIEALHAAARKHRARPEELPRRLADLAAAPRRARAGNRSRGAAPRGGGGEGALPERRRGSSRPSAQWPRRRCRRR